MFKRLAIVLILTFCIFISIGNSFAATSSEQLVKRIISVVYDDSYSMTKSAKYPEKQDDQYAMYALENVLGFTNDNDEVNIVRMSKKNDYQSYAVGSIAEKNESIANVASWKTYADETPFQAVETAISFLKDKKEQYGSGENIEYWLLVLTDGDLEGTPVNIEEYFDNIRNDMSDVKYESIWIFIGNDIKSSFSNEIKKVQGSNIIFSGNDQEICKAVYDACEIIYGRTSLSKSSLNESNGGKEIRFNFDFPISKIIVYEQDQDVGLKSVSTSDGKKYSDFTNIVTEKKMAPAIKSRIIQMANNNILPSGEVVLEFEDSIDTSENKFMLMVDLAIGLKLGYISKDKVFTDEATNEFGEGENVNFVTKVINLYDDSAFDLSSISSKVSATYDYDGKSTAMSFDPVEKCYRFTSPVKLGNNSFSSSLVYPGYFRLRTQPISIYVSGIPVPKKINPSISPDTIAISKKYDDYEKVGVENITFDGLNSDEKVTLEFSNIPEGIQLKVNGSNVKNNKVTTTVKGSQKILVDVYRNKDFKLTDTSPIEVFTKFRENTYNDRLEKSNLSFTIEPKERTMMLNISKEEGIEPSDLPSDKAYGKNLYYVKPMIDGVNISKEELKNSKISFNTDISKTKSKISYRIVDNNGENGFYIFLKAPLNRLNCAESFILTTNLITPFGEQVSSDKLTGLNEAVTVRIKSNPLPFILSIIGFLFFIWYLVGLIKKPRFEKSQHKIIVVKNGAEISNAPIRVNGGLSALVPYTPETGRAYDLVVVASDSKKAIYVDKKSLKEGMQYDSEMLIPPFRKDLKMKEDMPLVYSAGGDKTIYTYSNVRTGGGNSSESIGFDGGFGGASSAPTSKVSNASSSGSSDTSSSGPWG